MILDASIAATITRTIDFLYFFIAHTSKLLTFYTFILTEIEDFTTSSDSIG